MPRRSRFVAHVLSLAGFLGLHRFYLGRFWTGLLMLVTLGGFGIWWIVDIYLLLTSKLRDGDKQELVWFGGGSHPETPDAVAPTLQPREASEQAQTSEAEPTRPDEETRGTAGMSTISLPGQTKVSTLQERFKSEFGLILRVYDGRSFAEPDATIGQVRKKRGATSIDIRRNTKVGNLEDRFMEDFGIKVQIAGSDDSYLCDNDLTLAAALKEDERKLGRKATRAAAGEGQDPREQQEEGDDQMPDFDELIEKISDEFHKDPRNKVFAPQELLIASVKEEMGEDISAERLSSIVSSYEEGEIDGDEEEFYDAAVYCCGVLARKCFADDPEDEDAEVQYEISWFENEDGSIAAEIRPC